jgi:uncharacterized protein (DUF58 family)
MRWFISAIVLLLVSWALSAGLVVYAAAALAIVAIVGRHFASEGLGRVTATRTVSENEVTVGDSVEVELDIENDGRRSIVWALLEDLLPEAVLAQRPPRVVVKGKRLRVRSLAAGQASKLDYKLTFRQRGIYPIGPLVVESGDLFGFTRKARVMAPPVFVTVLPQVVPLHGYDIASRRPIGDVRLTHRLYEDPTRIAGVRQYMQGDPLNRIHWRATARTGQLHCKMYEPSTLAGATLLLDLHGDGYPPRGEPYRSELAATTAASLANAILLMHQQVGLWSNGADGAARWVEASLKRLKSAQVHIGDDQAEVVQKLRSESAEQFAVAGDELMGVPTRRGWTQLPLIRQLLARLELSEKRPFAEFAMEIAPRLPRDATVMAILPRVTEQTSLALGNLRRQGFAVAAIIVIPAEHTMENSLGQLAAEGIRDVRVLEHESQLPDICSAQIVPSVMALAN